MQETWRHGNKHQQNLTLAMVVSYVSFVAHAVRELNDTPEAF